MADRRRVFTPNVARLIRRHRHQTAEAKEPSQCDFQRYQYMSRRENLDLAPFAVPREIVYIDIDTKRQYQLQGDSQHVE